MKKLVQFGAVFVMLALALFISLGTYDVQAQNENSKSRFEKLELFSKIMFLIETQYYREVDPKRLLHGAIRGMMHTLDPHSAFLDEDVFVKIQEDTRGEFGGLGIEVTMKDGILIIITPIDDTPAFKAGIKPGDRIIEIDYENMVGATLEEAVEKMRGRTGTVIKLGISRDGVEGITTYEIKREVIKVEPVKSELVQDNYLYLRLTQFQRRSTDSVVKAIKKYQRQTRNTGGLKGIILDLRSNPGGLLDEAVSLSSVFMKEGPVVSTEGRDTSQREVRLVAQTGHKELDIPLVVLINGASASASEIVAGALQDAKRAMIMGTRSFGKGSVQTVAKVDETQGVKLTVAQYLTPLGRRIQAVGIEPDIEVHEVEGRWIEDHMLERQYVREEDLRNHLTATIESPEEKERRLNREKLQRQQRAARLERMRQQREKGTSETTEPTRPQVASEDYLVLQAIKTMQSYEVFRLIKEK
jgi:carboxyl-terminal processing protease